MHSSRCRPTHCRSCRSESTRLNSSHTVIYTLSLHDALPISTVASIMAISGRRARRRSTLLFNALVTVSTDALPFLQIGEHTSELQSHSDLHSFPTRRSSDLDSGLDNGHIGPSRAQALHAAFQCTRHGVDRRIAVL